MKPVHWQKILVSKTWSCWLHAYYIMWGEWWFTYQMQRWDGKSYEDMRYYKIPE